MLRSILAAVITLVPVAALALGGVTGEMAVCIAEESHAPHSTGPLPQPDCSHDGDGRTDTSEMSHFDCGVGDCRYVVAGEHATPAKSAGRARSSGQPRLELAVPVPAAQFAAAVSVVPAQVVDWPTGSVMAAVLTTVLRL